MKFEKIFPLNGKTNVKNAAIENLGNKKKVYITDLDFDHIIGTVENLDNLFYLNKYSIENHLISKTAIYEAIRTKDPKLKDHEIDALFDYNLLLEDATNCLKELASSFVIIQRHGLGLNYYGLNVSRDFNFTLTPPVYRMNFIPDYLKDVERELKNRNSRLSLNAQIRRLNIFFNNLTKAMTNIPGKYLLTFIKDRLQSLNLIHQTNLESFMYALSKDFNSSELEYLKINVNNYIR